MIIYFSGTGNSRYAASYVAGLTGMDVSDMGDSIRKGSHIDINKGDVVFSTPTYAWRIPRPVEDWIRDNRDLEGRRAWFIMTCGTDTGDAGRYLRKLCSERGMEYMGYMTVVMPENYVAMFPVPERDEAVKIVKKAEGVLGDAAGHILRGEAFRDEKVSVSDRIKSGVVNDLFYPLFVRDRAFYAGEECISCGLCADVCVMANITMKDGRPVWGGRCTHCMACICRCPAGAIEYGRKSRGRPRYTCPL